MGDEVEAQAGGDGLQHALMLRVLELDHAAGLHIDQVVVVAVLGGFVAGAAAAEIPAFQDAALLQQAHGAVDGGNRDARIQLHRAAVQLLHVGVVVGVRQDARDHAALPRHLEAPFDAEAFDAAFHPISRAHRGPCPQ